MPHKDGEVWRDDSPPAFTAKTPTGSHPAWWYTLSGRDWGPYYTRRDAEAALSGWGHAEAARSRGRRLGEAVAVTDRNPTGDEELEDL